MTRNYKPKLPSFLEDIIVLVVMFGVFLSIRLIFFSFVSDSWVGSFGLISLAAFITVYLSKKNKLGYFGKIYWKVITRVHRGKRRIVVYCSMFFVIYFLGSITLGIGYAETNPEILELKSSMIQAMSLENKASLDKINTAVINQDVIQTHDELMNVYNQISQDRIFLGFFLVFLLPVLDPVVWSVIVSTIDDILDGWMLHFATVLFIETLEGVGILIYTYHQTRNSKKGRISK